MSFTKIGLTGTTVAYYCQNTRQFLCLCERGAAILEAFELGLSLEEVLEALRCDTVNDAEHTTDLWRTLTRCKSSTGENQPAVCPNYFELDSKIISTKNFTEHLEVDCGSLKVRISATSTAALKVFPIITKYYKTQTATQEKIYRDYIFLVDSPDGLIEKKIYSPLYKVPTQSADPERTFIETSRDLTELACNDIDNLCVLHAATLQKGDKTLILCNPSGSGKTTLAWLLASSGFELIHDDVLPIRLDSQVEMLRTPSTVKEGSWSILENAGFTLPDKCYYRLGSKVKYLPIENMDSIKSLENIFILFPKYDLINMSNFQKLTPMDTFINVIQDECVIQNRSLDRLSKIFKWITSSHGAAMTYNNTELAINIIKNWMKID